LAYDSEDKAFLEERDYILTIKEIINFYYIMEEIRYNWGEGTIAGLLNPPEPLSRFEILDL